MRARREGREAGMLSNRGLDGGRVIGDGLKWWVGHRVGAVSVRRRVLVTMLNLGPAGNFNFPRNLVLFPWSVVPIV
jgi:hypothetical protein